MTPDLERLIQLGADRARAARARAYVPYSGFHMGAAVVDTTGEVAAGVLVENISLGLAMCAERVALFGAVTDGLRPVVLAVCSRRTEGELTFPCGACLQVALEVAGPDLVVVAVDPDGVRDSAELGAVVDSCAQAALAARLTVVPCETVASRTRTTCRPTVGRT